VVGTVIDIARCLHPDARLDDLARVLPVQLEFGIPPELVCLAQRAGAALDRTDYLRLASRSLADPAAILEADDDVLLSCLNGNTRRLQALQQAARAARDGDNSTDFADLLPASDRLIPHRERAHHERRFAGRHHRDGRGRSLADL
jgi:ATP-dependent DNA helicase